MSCHKHLPMIRRLGGACSQRLFSCSVVRPSFIGRAPISVPQDVQVSVIKGEGAGKPGHVTIKGPLGSLSHEFPTYLEYRFEDHGRLAKLSLMDDSLKKHKQMFGTTRALINNSVLGVSEGYVVILRLQGIGYRASFEADKKVLNLRLGLSHPVNVEVPDDIKCSTPNQTRIVLEGIDKQRVTQLAARIKSYRKPEPYKGKGIYVGDETIKLKERKKAR